MDEMMAAFSRHFAEPAPDPEWVTVKQLAKAFGLDRRTANERANKLVESGALKKHRRLGPNRRITFYYETV